MAVTLPATGSGTATPVVATDTIAAEEWQEVKIGIGAAGSATLLTGNTGVVTAGTVRVTLATDVALPAGTNAIGKLAANSGVDIGDVDVTSVIPGTGATSLGKAIDTATGATDTGVLLLATRDDALSALTPIEGDNIQLRVDANGALWTRDDVLEVAISGSEMQVDVITVPAPLSTTGGGTEATALRVTLANDSTGVVSVDDNGGALTVDNGGTFAVQAAQSGTWNIGTVTTVSTVSALGTGTTGPMKAEDVAHATGDMGIPAWGVRQDTPNATFAASNDYHILATDMVGGIRTALYETDFAVLGTNHVKKYTATTGAVTDTILWSPAAGKRWYVTDILFTTSAAATITFEDDLVAGDSVVMAFDLAANGGVAHHFSTPLFSGEDAADLLITTSAGNGKFTIVGYEI